MALIDHIDPSLDQEFSKYEAQFFFGLRPTAGISGSDFDYISFIGPLSSEQYDGIENFNAPFCNGNGECLGIEEIIFNITSNDSSFTFIDNKGTPVDFENLTEQEQAWYQWLYNSIATPVSDAVDYSLDKVNCAYEFTIKKVEDGYVYTAQKLEEGYGAAKSAIDSAVDATKKASIFVIKEIGAPLASAGVCYYVGTMYPPIGITMAAAIAIDNFVFDNKLSTDISEATVRAVSFSTIIPKGSPIYLAAAFNMASSGIGDAFSCANAGVNNALHALNMKSEYRECSLSDYIKVPVKRGMKEVGRLAGSPMSGHAGANLVYKAYEGKLDLPTAGGVVLESASKYGAEALFKHAVKYAGGSLGGYMVIPTKLTGVVSRSIMKFAYRDWISDNYNTTIPESSLIEDSKYYSDWGLYNCNITVPEICLAKGNK